MPTENQWPLTNFHHLNRDGYFLIMYFLAITTMACLNIFRLKLKKIFNVETDCDNLITPRRFSTRVGWKNSMPFYRGKTKKNFSSNDRSCVVIHCSITIRQFRLRAVNNTAINYFIITINIITALNYCYDSRSIYKEKKTQRFKDEIVPRYDESQ